MNFSDDCDYSLTGMTIQQAMVTSAKRQLQKSVIPRSIMWDGFRIQTSDKWEVPERGVVRAEFLATSPQIIQGFDLKTTGWLELSEGERVSTLRTWKSDRFEDVVAYPFFAPDRLLWVWNVYVMNYPNGITREEKWTDNAGFWCEHVSDTSRIYHCSPGMLKQPDFESLIFKVSIESIDTVR